MEYKQIYRAYDTLPVMPCIYAIEHLGYGKMYIGSTKDLRQRLCTHWSQLRLDKHQVNTLKADFDEVGRGGFRILVFEELLPGLTRKQREDIEQGYVDMYWDSGVLYNQHKNVKPLSRLFDRSSGPGHPAWNKGKKLSAEHRAKLTGPHSAERIAIRSAANKHPAWQHVDEIKALRTTGLVYSKIAEKYNCHPTVIGRICLSDNFITEPVLEAL
jgi:group I intron endonuclease